MIERQKTIVQHLLNASTERPADWVAIRFKRHKSWIELSWREYYQRGEAAALGLAALGVGEGDRVAILAQTRWEWAAVDMATMGLGAVTVPIYQSHRPEEVEQTLQHSGARVLILEDAGQLRKWEQIHRRCKQVDAVICIQPPADMPEGILGWDDFLNRGIEKYKNQPDFFAKAVRRGKASDLATIVYTSGTTGEPKGVMLTHEQILSEVEDVHRAFPISNADSTLSFLPYAHVLGRVELWLHTYSGFTMSFAEGIERLRENLAETRPTVMIGVPRVFEKIYADIMTRLEAGFWRKKAFALLKGGGWVRAQVADRVLYSKLRDGLGGRLRFVVSGGAALDPQLAFFFRQAGLLLLEGYGLTETTAAITTNLPQSYEFGTVGKPMGDVEIKLAGDGEILVKSAKVMRGYYKNDEATREVLVDGYFHTGDIGEWTPAGFLKITDRKKDLIKTSGGKYVAPQKLENLLKANPLIANALIYGDGRKYVVALITLNASFAKVMAKEKGWMFRDLKALSQLPEMREAVRKAVAAANAQLASFETIKNFMILPEDFSLEKGELTASLKIKRKVLDVKYRELLDGMY